MISVWKQLVLLGCFDCKTQNEGKSEEIVKIRVVCNQFNQRIWPMSQFPGKDGSPSESGENPIKAL